MARINYALVCLDRMAKFTTERGREWVAQKQLTRLQSVSADIASLLQYTEGVVNRIQLLQDAATGIINVAQNEVMKILTIASVAGIPPVLGCRDLWNELQEHAGTELGVGLSIRYRFDCRHDAYSADLVQVEGLDLIFGDADASFLTLSGIM